MRLPLGVQDALVALLALAALGWLVRRWWRRRSSAAACEDCPGCASARARHDAPKPASGATVVIPLSEFVGRR